MSEPTPLIPHTDQLSPLDFSDEQETVFAIHPDEWDTAVSEVRSARLGVVTPAYLQSIAFGTDSPRKLTETQAQALLEALQSQGIVSKEEQKGVGFAVLPEFTDPPRKPGKLRSLGRVALRAIPGEVRKQTKEYTAVRTQTVANGAQVTARGAVKSAKFVSGSTHREKQQDARKQAAEKAAADLRWDLERQTHMVLDGEAHLATEPVQTAEEREQERAAALAAVHESRARREGIRDKDLELKEEEQAIRAEELKQRKRVLQLRNEALARGEIIDVTPPARNDRQESGRENDAMQDYLKRKTRWDEQTTTIERYKSQDKFADLFDEEKLLNLDAAIQASAAPKYDAALRNRLAELNQSLPDEQKWKSVDAMTVQEREEASKKVLTGKERGDIANPIDNEHTARYLGDAANDRNLVLAISWQRRRLAGRSHEPRPPKKTQTQ